AAVVAMSTSTPSWSMGVTTMKMISSTSTTSTRGVMLMSDLTPPLLPPLAMPMGDSLQSLPCRLLLVLRVVLDEVVHQLGGGVVHLDREFFDVIGELVEHHDRRDGDEQAARGGVERFRDAARDRADAARTGLGHAFEGVDDA